MSETKAEYKTAPPPNGSQAPLPDALIVDEYRRRKRKIILACHEQIAAIRAEQLKELVALDREYWQKYPAVMERGRVRVVEEG